MKERGIIFNGEMVRATLDGLKTQTRRVVRHQPDEDGLARLSGGPWMDTSEKVYRCPYGEVGDRLWVRETWSLLGNEDACPIDWNDNLVKGGGVDAARIYRASCEQKPGDYGLWSIPDDADWKPHTDDMKFEGAWTPSIHMPRWASRITLEITDVRVERLNDISEEDAKAEGCINSLHLQGGRFANENFAWLWQSIYGAESWDANPWVWVIVFKRIKGD
ncbi:hypothetical protein AB6D34_09215 [Pectobacterium brasiliense]|uniref:Uncharacterized protein n=1 Tax=Pectobacterium brasiliense TaxID=180957 RepID=A0A433NJD3_9GAMM|nr:MULTISPECIES: hypothetical protein [Pectobacterium]GKW27807.1 hypothetical protein PEC331060_09850 [Pectobacterium carotovorum subsp. carotovorum]MBN3046549.1 hypothetical protein [Pectobacterium brasiliense]MBN3056802.1 hypothetical protein [Pectobacterium brasiliense]MBN3075318.1 hypothetical protein [Pectobacterium brasiliense]MBN3083556.1 hypothetical protein [Pectobacterium brasiliense]